MFPNQMKNWVKIGWSRPRLLRIAATCSEFALSPAITAAGSPGVRRSIRNTNTATISITGRVASRRRRMYPSIALFHLDVPQRERRRSKQTAHVLAERLRLHVLAERKVRRIV